MRFQTRPSFGHRNKDFAVQQLVPHLAVKALLEPVLSGAAWVNILRRTAAVSEPALDFACNELRAIICRRRHYYASLRTKRGTPREANNGFKAKRTAWLVKDTPTVTESHSRVTPIKP